MSDEREVTYEIDLQSFRDALNEMAAALNAIRYQPVLWQPIPPRITCKLCGARYKGSALVDLDRICPGCWDHLNSIAEKAGDPIRVEDIVRLMDHSSRWTDQAIRYGRPWQEHVPARSRHLIREAS